MEKQVARPFMKVFQPITLEHVEENPVTFHSEKELRDYCRKNKIQSGALL